MKRGLIVLLLLLVLAPTLRARVWTSRSGKGLQADFIAEKGEWIYLMKPNGKHLKIRISDLCEADRTHIYYKIVKPLSEKERKEKLENASAEIWLKRNTGDESAPTNKKNSITLTLNPVDDKGFVGAFDPPEEEIKDLVKPDESTSVKTERVKSKPKPKYPSLTVNKDSDKKPTNPALLNNMSKEAISFYLIWLIPPFIIRYAILRQSIRHLYSLFLSSGIIYCAIKTFTILSHQKADYIPLALIGFMAWGIMSSSERTRHVMEIAQIRRCPNCKKKIKIKLMETSSVTNCPKCNAPLSLPKHNPSGA